MKFLISIFFGFALMSLANAMTFKEVGTGGNCSTRQAILLRARSRPKRQAHLNSFWLTSHTSSPFI